MLDLGIDVGGTFTDLIASDGLGNITVMKVPSTPRAPEAGALTGIGRIIDRSDVKRMGRVSHATTIATNVLFGQMNLDLPKAALITTEGFRDVLQIGRGNRPRLYDLTASKPEPLVLREFRWEVGERIGPKGEVIRPMDLDSVNDVIERARRTGVQTIGVCLLNSHLNPVHERRLKETLAASLPGVRIVTSHEVSPEHREYERTSTTVVNALLSPVVEGYVARFEERLRERGHGGELLILRSDGGLSSSGKVTGVPATMIESGPAAGVVAAAHLGQLMGERSVLSFDMGGTTAKAGSVLDSRPDVVHEYEVGGEVNVGRVLKGSGHPVRHPFIDLVECSAGGGSIAWVDDGGALRVGPLSAGADPGPACYGRGDHPTITDADLVLGRLPGTLAGDLRLDKRRAERAIAERICDPLDLGLHQAAEGILQIADSTMSRILRIVSLERGRDPRHSVLMAFGGGGPLHCCSVAGELGMDDVLVPPHPGLFSAMGLLFAKVSAQRERAVMRDLRTLAESHVETILQELEEECRGEVGTQGSGLTFERMADLRYEGQSFELPVRPRAFDPDGLRTAFERMHLQLYGHVCDDGVELVNLRAVATVDRPPPVIETEPGLAVGQATIGERGIWWEGRWHQATVLGGDALAPGERIEGPVVRFGYDHTLFVPPGWALRAERSGCLRMRRSG